MVCGSLHPAARRQLDVLRAERPEVEILDSPLSIDGRGAREVATTLGTEARARLLDGGHRTLVLIGGDTAAATLGDGPVVVGGTLATGLPWLRRSDGSGPLILTRSGGFGDDRALVELFEEGVPR